MKKQGKVLKNRKFHVKQEEHHSLSKSSILDMPEKNQLVQKKTQLISDQKKNLVQLCLIFKWQIFMSQHEFHHIFQFVILVFYLQCLFLVLFNHFFVIFFKHESHHFFNSHNFGAIFWCFVLQFICLHIPESLPSIKAFHIYQKNE